VTLVKHSWAAIVILHRKKSILSTLGFGEKEKVSLKVKEKIVCN